MNILFISYDADPPNMGGTATVVNVLAQYFQKEGHLVSLAYQIVSNTPSLFFKEKIYLNIENYENVKSFFDVHKFDIIYNTMAMDTNWNLLTKVKSRHTIIISAYHNRPWLRFMSMESIFFSLYASNSFLKKMHCLTLFIRQPFKKINSQTIDKHKFNLMIEHSDKIHLLSKGYIPIFKRLAPKVNENNIITIGNPLVFETELPIKELDFKQKKILVVTSINYQKRAYLMIKIWKEIEKDSRFSDWSFDFVGDGDGLKFLKDMVKNLNIKRINFYKTQNPYFFYRQSSIFIMTSRFEGWPMVLMESMQMGVVPIVYNSFEALSDIITHNVDGIIVKNNNNKKFVEQLKEIMQNSQKLKHMQQNAILNSAKFAIDIIGEKYLKLFSELIYNGKL